MSVKQVQEALKGLQEDALRRREYNTWLQNFQRTTEAWQVTGEVLNDSTAPRDLKIFCAQTLRNKAAYDLHQVPIESRIGLKDEVIQLLETNRELLQVVGANLCIALAAMAMQITDWKTPLWDMINQFGTIEMAPLLFEFLKTLPEEFQSKQSGLINHDVILERSTELIQKNAYIVMDFMLNHATAMANSTETKILFFEAVNCWLPEVSLEDILASPLVPWMLSSIGDEEVRGPAVDCLVTILRETKEVYEPVVQQAIEMIYPELLKAFNSVQHLLKEDGDLHREIARLFSEACKSWCTLIAKDPENFSSVLEILIQIIVIPDEDLNIVDMTFPFFDKFRSLIGEPMPAMDDRSYYVDSSMRAPFKPLFLKLLSALTILLELPSESKTLDKETAFREFRYEVGDMIKVCGSVAGYDAALEWYYQRVINLKGQGSSLQSVEALLFSWRAIARTIPLWENNWMPQLCDQLFNLPHIDQESVQHAAIMLLGRYAEWFTVHEQYLLATLRQLIRSSWSEFDSVRRASAHAFLYLCTDACTELCKYIPEIMDFYTSLTGKTELDSLISYSDGIGCVINQLSDPTLTEAIERVFSLTKDRTVLFLSSQQLSNNENIPTLERVAFDIHGLGCIVGQIPVLASNTDTETNHPLRTIVMNHNALFTKCLRDYGPQHPVMMESICRYYIRVLFNLANTLQYDLSLLIETLSHCIELSPHSSILYELASVLCQCYNPYVHTSADVYQQVWEFLHQTSLKLFDPKFLEMIETDGSKMSDLTPLHQIVFQGFHMLCDEAVYFPDKYLASDLPASIQLSAHIIRNCYNIDTLTAIGHFYDDIRSLAPKTPPKDGSNMYTEHITQAFKLSGSYLLEALIYFFMMKPDAYFEYRAENLTDFLFRLVPEEAMAWLNKLMSDLPAGSTSEIEVNECLEQVTRNIVISDSRGVGLDLNRFIKAYSARNFDPRI